MLVLCLFLTETNTVQYVARVVPDNVCTYRFNRKRVFFSLLDADSIAVKFVNTSKCDMFPETKQRSTL